MRLQIPGIGYKQGGRQMVTTAMNPVALIKTVSKPEPWNPVGNQPHGNRPRDERHVKGIVEYLETEEHFVIGAVVLYASPKEAKFTPHEGGSEGEEATCVGTLSLDIGATFDIGDGQHRISAYDKVIQGHSEEGDAVIERLRASGQPLVVVIDDNQLHRAQDFADLQRNVKTLASSIGMSMDRRKSINRAMLALFEDPELPIFGHEGSADRVEFLKDSPGKLSAKLFSFKTIRYASGTALIGVSQRSTASWEKAVSEHLETEATGEKARAELRDLWAGLSELTPYADVIDGNISAKELRESTYLTSAGVLYAIGYAVHRAVRDHGMDVQTAVKALDTVDFARTPNTMDITPADTIFAGNLVDPDSGKIGAGRAAWESAADALLKRIVPNATA